MSFYARNEEKIMIRSKARISVYFRIFALNICECCDRRELFLLRLFIFSLTQIQIMLENIPEINVCVDLQDANTWKQQKINNE